MGPRGPGYDLDKLCAAIITYYLYLNTKCTRRGGGGGGGGGGGEWYSGEEHLKQILSGSSNHSNFLGLYLQA